VPKDQQNGVITGYTVQVTAEVSGLRPGTSYYFSVSAMTVAGTGPPTRSFSTTPAGGKTYELQ
jgi:phosphodiesterase/alkaline phosphatase D-like protein